jgi:hypothetical protein
MYWMDDVVNIEVHGGDVGGRKIWDDPPGLQLNHYKIMSKEYFDKVKKPRGNAFYPENKELRTDAYFDEVDKRSTEKDTQLRDILKKME